jgi:TonB family protein
MSEQPTYEASEVDEPPRLSNASDVRRQLARNYPPLLRDAGISGDVSMRLLVLSNGTVEPESTTILTTAHEQFNDAAFRTVRRMRFRPGMVGNSPVHVWIEYPVEFRLR